MEDYKAYRKAPTWLWDSAGNTKLFETQDSVDKAWETGWFAPKGFKAKKSVLSDSIVGEGGDYETKSDWFKAIKADTRYQGFSPNMSRSVDEIRGKMVEFEIKQGLNRG